MHLFNHYVNLIIRSTKMFLRNSFHKFDNKVVIRSSFTVELFAQNSTYDFGKIEHYFEKLHIVERNYITVETDQKLYNQLEGNVFETRLTIINIYNDYYDVYTSSASLHTCCFSQYTSYQEYKIFQIRPTHKTIKKGIIRIICLPRYFRLQMFLKHCQKYH